MKHKTHDGQYGEQETRGRMDDALRRALSTPHQPHKSTSKKGGSKAAAKPPRKKAREL